MKIIKKYVKAILFSGFLFSIVVSYAQQKNELDSTIFHKDNKVIVDSLKIEIKGTNNDTLQAADTASVTINNAVVCCNQPDFINTLNCIIEALKGVEKYNKEAVKISGMPLGDKIYYTLCIVATRRDGYISEQEACFVSAAGEFLIQKAPKDNDIKANLGIEIIHQVIKINIASFMEGGPYKDIIAMVNNKYDESNFVKTDSKILKDTIEKSIKELAKDAESPK